LLYEPAIRYLLKELVTTCLNQETGDIWANWVSSRGQAAVPVLMDELTLGPPRSINAMIILNRIVENAEDPAECKTIREMITLKQKEGCGQLMHEQKYRLGIFVGSLALKENEIAAVTKRIVSATTFPNFTTPRDDNSKGPKRSRLKN
jgi:hypothetical protein